MQENEHTKKILSQALQQLTQRKSFTKITISDITQASGFNRQTFYYHFRDKYELLTWIYEQDANAIFDEDMDFDNWHVYMEKLLTHYKQNEHFYLNTVRSDEQYFGDFIFSLTKHIFITAFDILDVDHHLETSDKSFYAHFFSFGIRGVIINWIQTNMKESPINISTNLKHLAQDSIQIAYRRHMELHEKGE